MCSVAITLLGAALYLTQAKIWWGHFPASPLSWKSSVTCHTVLLLAFSAPVLRVGVYSLGSYSIVFYLLAIVS
jgi:hypothetical protein